MVSYFPPPLMSIPHQLPSSQQSIGTHQSMIQTDAATSPTLPDPATISPSSSSSSPLPTNLNGNVSLMSSMNKSELIHQGSFPVQKLIAHSIRMKSTDHRYPVRCCSMKECLKNNNNNNNNYNSNLIVGHNHSYSFHGAKKVLSRDDQYSLSLPPCCVYQNNCITCMNQMTNSLISQSNQPKSSFTSNDVSTTTVNAPISITATTTTPTMSYSFSQPNRPTIDQSILDTSTAIHENLKGIPVMKNGLSNDYMIRDFQSPSPTNNLNGILGGQDDSDDRNFDNFNSNIFNDHTIPSKSSASASLLLSSPMYAHYSDGTKGHDCFRKSVPTLPIAVSVLLFLVNCFIPGLGTFLATLTILFGSQTEYGKDQWKRAFCISIFAASIQALTSIFVIGWVWSIMWGINLIKNSAKIKDQKYFHTMQSDP